MNIIIKLLRINLKSLWTTKLADYLKERFEYLKNKEWNFRKNIISGVIKNIAIESTIITFLIKLI